MTDQELIDAIRGALLRLPPQEIFGLLGVLRDNNIPEDEKIAP